MDLTLIAILDARTVPRDRIGPWLEGAARGGVTGVQFREKILPLREAVSYGRSLFEASRSLGLWTSVDDRLDLALALGADLLHLGRDDMSPDIARAAAPKIALGLSARTLEELVWAGSHRPAYVGFGPVFPTPSKADASDPQGLEALARAVATSPVPVVAIGGIDSRRAPSVWWTGVRGIAAISALTQAADVAGAARALLVGRAGGPGP